MTSAPSNRPGRRWLALALVLVAGVIAPVTRVGASPGDPLETFGDDGTLLLGDPPGCSGCPVGSSQLLQTHLESSGTSTIVGYQWLSTPVDPEERPISGSAIAVSESGGPPTESQVTIPEVGFDRTLMAVGFQPSTSRSVAVVRVETWGATREDANVPLRQEIRRFNPDGSLAGTVELPASSHGVWIAADVGPDGSVVGLVEGVGAGDKPVTTVRRYGPTDALRWTVSLPPGDVVEAIDVSSTGMVVVAGSRMTDDEAYDGLVAAWADGGTPVASFGGAGIRTFPAANGFGRAFADVDIEGESVALVGDDQWQGDDDDDAPGAMVVVRLEAGVPVTSFAGDGIAERTWARVDGQRIEVSGVLIDGARTVVSGQSVAVDGFRPRALLSRYLASGSLDAAFAIDSTVNHELRGLAAVPGGYAAVGSSGSAGGDPWVLPVYAFAAAGTGSVGPPAPTALAVTAAGAGTITLGWNPSGGAAGYELWIDTDGDATSDVTDDLPAISSTPLSVPGDRVIRVALRARGSGGLGPLSAWSQPSVPPFRTLDSFTDRQVRDILGRAPTTAELSAWRSALGGGEIPSTRISTTLDSSVWSGVRSPVIRLYRAYFLRLPDTGGLDYWVAQSRSGRSLAQISQSFAASPEFRTLYGSLSNRQFVELIYRNILGRPGEPAGVSYWTSELDSRRRTRGSVMTGFSESPEYKGASQPVVDVVLAYSALLRRVPSSGEAGLWTPVLSAGVPRTEVIAHLLSTPEYDQRIP